MDGCCRYEPSLDDLLADEMMEPVLKSAGLDTQGFRAMMVETARRLRHHEPRSSGREGVTEGLESQAVPAGRDHYRQV
jgi:hypothetical protein